MPKIIAIPAFNDNYIWVIYLNQQQVAIIDPGCAEAVNAFLQQYQLALSTILITHCHHDHIGGVQSLYKKHRCKIIAPVYDQIENCTISAKDGDSISLNSDIQFNVIHTPGHTPEHIIYHNDTTIFTGDTLFTGGCGRAFYNIEKLYLSLQKIKQLPATATIYCAHEYTLNNLNFATMVDPKNTCLQNRYKNIQEQYKLAKNTASATLQTELNTNPFLRTQQSSIINSVNSHYNEHIQNDMKIFQKLRQWKDNC